MTADLVQALWDERVGWSKTADRLKARRGFWRLVVLLLTVSGAALQTLAASMKTSPVGFGAGVLGAVALALVPFLVGFFVTAKDTQSWLRARSVAEGIKSEIFMFRANVEPYVGPNAIETLRKKVGDIEGWAKNLELERAGVGSPTEPAPTVLDTADYLQLRVYQQINDYYRPNAKKNAELAERFRWATIAMAGLAAVLSAGATFVGAEGSATMGPWVAVVTTIGGSISTHAAAGRYDFQATTYFATARQLLDLALGWQAGGKAAPSKEWSQFVRGCEEAISAENRGWMAKLDQQ